jgi:lysophospholipase L1-like esterase
MQRRILAVLVSAAAVLAPAGSAAASSGDHAHGGHGPRTTTYLALGDSLAAGYQPGRGDNRTGGYVGQVLAGLDSPRHPAELVNLACSGETAASMVSGGHCDIYPAGNQLAQAVAYLRAHPGQTKVITVDIGANDVQRCLAGGTIDTVCIQAGMAAVHTNLAVIFDELRDAAPQARIVALTYYDPFLAAWLLGPTGQGLAASSLDLADALNVQIKRAAARERVEIADVARAFRSHTWRVVSDPTLGSVPKNVQLVCQLTWMCTLGDIHATDGGYAVLAHTVLARLDERRR